MTSSGGNRGKKILADFVYRVIFLSKNVTFPSSIQKARNFGIIFIHIQLLFAKGHTHFCRIKDGGGAGRPTSDNFKDETEPNKFFTGKGIYRRVRFILDIDKVF